MNIVKLKLRHALTLALATLLTVGPVLAQQRGDQGSTSEQRPDWRNDDGRTRQVSPRDGWRDDRHEARHDNRNDLRRDDRRDGRRDWREARRDDRHEHNNRWQRERGHPYDGRRGFFEHRHQTLVRDYYVQQYRSGYCPPGLARRNNGCLPPGYARNWHYGQPLPRGVIYYEVPHVLVTRIGPPPHGYRYVRVGSDILMIAIGTGLIVDAIQDLRW